MPRLRDEVEEEGISGRGEMGVGAHLPMLSEYRFRKMNGV